MIKLQIIQNEGTISIRHRALKTHLHQEKQNELYQRLKNVLGVAFV